MPTCSSHKPGAGEGHRPLPLSYLPTDHGGGSASERKQYLFIQVDELVVGKFERLDGVQHSVPVARLNVAHETLH